MSALAATTIWSAAFVSTHLLMSHPLRAPLVARLGSRGFLLVYSLVSILTLGLAVKALRDGPAEAMLWTLPPWGWAIATVVMWLASVLLVGSVRGNPALVNPVQDHETPSIGEPRGVFRITRHPMMWSFALWALVHGSLVSRPAHIVLALAILLLALLGAAGQDRKKAALVGPAWVHWRERTSFIPFARGFALPRAFDLIGGTILFLLATWLHPYPVGVWAWL